MSQVIITKQDFNKIHRSITDAKAKNSIKKEEAEKLLAELKSAKIVEQDKIEPDVVTMNSIVKIHFQNNKTTMEFQLVYPADANIKERKISIFSSVASALIGYRVGDEIDWLIPSGMTKIVIDEVIYQPESAGDFDL
ncbi:nucleoside diphosphate kinase regulator [Chryseobacterium gotjawalense]|uniref:Regulator of nucleoside diphosphate kinase n=2 Tax=Chryseobacterium TaxID=59732 RepID=A0A4P6ZHD9_9FLAO|nr:MULTISPECIES: nucleoside diphosphate kinase regulator [Chryseobacterium]MDQ0475777.1 regulator of nucleoside diphosphate kinase [Chryseobacterium sp. MDT2-18]QBO59206.1 Regulator of nucleoside diphosphate kinase [Chryseobacterium salivictor]WHF52199.1 nucleoside diphosphate kinase regulator [Chryseobacterium sp. wdc7]